MKTSAIDSKVIPFTSASNRHLNLLGIDIVGDLEIDSDRIKALDLPESLPNTINKTLRQDFKKHFNLSDIISTDAGIKDALYARYLIRKPHVAVFSEVLINETIVSNNGVSYAFHGFLDYGVGLIKSGDQEALEDGSHELDFKKALTGVVAVKSSEEMQSAHPQIVMQVLVALVTSGRTTFTGALSNGALWRFYTAEHGGRSGYQVYSSALYRANRHGGLIVELLKDMILYEKSPLITTMFDGPPAKKRQRTV